MMSFLVQNALMFGVFVLALMLVGVVITVLKNVHTVAPNQVAVVSGTRRDVEGGKRGYRVVTGGRFLLIPVLERVDYLFLNLMTFPVEVVNVPSVNGPTVSVRAIANVKVMSTEEALALVIERFLGQPPQKIQEIAKENLESNLRSIVGKLSIEELISKRDALQSQVLEEAKTDLAKMGLGVDLFNVQEVKDDQGYIKALGETRTAQVKRDAEMGKASAEKEAAVSVAASQREASIAEAAAAQAISDAAKARDVQVAANEAEVVAAQARIDIAAKVAAQEAQAGLNRVTVEAEKVRTIANTELAELEQKRRDAELRATVIIAAEREKEARLIAAEAGRQAASLDGEALRVKEEKIGLGIQARLTAEAEARKATAAAVLAEKQAEAQGQEAMLKAQASGVRAQGLAEAEVTRAKLSAEAEGTLKKAEAFKALDESGRFLMIMEASPQAIRAIGEAIGQAVKPLADGIGMGLSGIDEVRIVDMGGKKGEGEGNLLQQFAGLPVETIFDLQQKAKAAGLDKLFGAIAERAGVKLE